MTTEQASTPPANSATNVVKMPRYTYYLSNYQYLDPSAIYTLSNDDDKACGISPKFGVDTAGDENGSSVMDVQCTSGGLLSPYAPKEGGAHIPGSHSTDPNDHVGQYTVLPRFGGTSSSDNVIDGTLKPKACSLDADDELCSASVMDECVAFDSDAQNSMEEPREPSTQLYIDQSLATKMERWTARYAAGNVEEFRKRQRRHMDTLLGDTSSKGGLCEFPIRCIFIRGETGSDGKFDPLYIKPGDVLADRYSVVDIIGNTAFSMVVKARDDNTGEYVCIKISMPDTINQAIDEINLLTILNTKDAQEARAIVQLKGYFYFRGCIFTILELLGANLYEATREFYKRRNLPHTSVISRERCTPTNSDKTQGWTLDIVRQIAIDVLVSLKYMHGMGLIDCDLKPENLVINNGAKVPFVKLIDFGSSCYIQEQLNNYVQSRSYRAPEVILGLPYDTQIDLWSLGCLLVEIYMQRILFPSDNNATLMASMISLLGVPPVYILQHKMNSTFMVLPNGNVADLSMTAEIVKSSHKLMPSDYQSSMRCNISVSNSSCCSLVATQPGNKTDANADIDSVVDLSESNDHTTALPSQEYVNVTPKKYSMVEDITMRHCEATARYNQVSKGIKLDIGHGRSNPKCVRIIEPTRCSIDEMLNTNSSPELAAFADFIKGLLQYDPIERLTATTALTHSFITQQ